MGLHKGCFETDAIGNSEMAYFNIEVSQEAASVKLLVSCVHDFARKKVSQMYNDNVSFGNDVLLYSNEPCCIGGYVSFFAVKSLPLSQEVLDSTVNLRISKYTNILQRTKMQKTP